jgi:hypothetical protein
MNTNEELLAMLKDVAKQLDDAANGRLFRVDGERVVIEDIDEYMEAHGIEDGEELELVTVANILDEDSLGDIRWEVNNKGEMFSGRVCTGFGGPNIYITDCEARGYWGFGGPVVVDLSDKASDDAWNYFADAWECAKCSFR